MAQPRPRPNSADASHTGALPAGVRIAAVVSSFHEELCAMMCASARRELESEGLAPENFFEVRAPGAFELPLIARRLAVRDDIQAVLCFGLVLKGETSHDGYIATAAASGILNASLQVDKPILFGVLTCDSEAQAEARALPADQGGRHDKGREVARAAIMAIDSLKLAGLIGTVESVAGFASRAPEGGSSR